MLKKDCFGYKETQYGGRCTALQKLECDGCKFYHTKTYYEKYVKKLKNKSQGV